MVFLFGLWHWGDSGDGSGGLYTKIIPFKSISVRNIFLFGFWHGGNSYSGGGGAHEF